MAAMVTEAWALAAGCKASVSSPAAARELPVQQHSLPWGSKKAKKAAAGVACRAGVCTKRSMQPGRYVAGRRSGVASCLLAALLLPGGGGAARGAILEADDDVELLERVKEDRKKRLQKQGIISSSGTETGYLQDLIYKLSKVGQAIDKNDLPAASRVLGQDSGAQWVHNINAAFSKFSSSPEEKNVVDRFNSSLTSLFTSVNKLDEESSKSAFVSSATALEKWIALAGLGGQLKGF